MKSILIITILGLMFSPSPKNIPTALDTNIVSDKETLKHQAFEVLKTKCNVCHQKKNKKRVFTIDNMDRFGKKIHRQVFKWKRMPKGNDIKLTDKEYQQLKKLVNINRGHLKIISSYKDYKPKIIYHGNEYQKHHLLIKYFHHSIIRWFILWLGSLSHPRN